MRYLRLDILIITFLFLINVVIQTHNLGRYVEITDEGVYLYAAKLITQGYIPYKDFFIAHPPILLYLGSLFLLISGFDLNIVRTICVIFFFSSIFPLYFLIVHITKNRLAAVLSIILFSTFVELVKSDVRFFALRQLSIPFLSFGLFFLYVKAKYKLAGLLLGVFALCIVSNLLIASLLTSIFILEKVIFKKNKFRDLKKITAFFLAFFIVVFLGYGIAFLIPRGFESIILFHLQRPIDSYPERIIQLAQVTVYGGSIILFGLLGSFSINSKIPFIGIFNVLSLLIILYLSRSFYPFYFSILSVGLTISCGILFARLMTNKLLAIILSLELISIIYVTSFDQLYNSFIRGSTPEFFETVDALKKTEGSLFTFEQIFALEANKDMTFHYYLVDGNGLRLKEDCWDEKCFERIIAESDVLVADYHRHGLLLKENLEYINNNFDPFFKNGSFVIYQKKDKI